MASPIQIIDDDEDEFDWDAAVREIDVACLNTTTNHLETPPPPIAEAVVAVSKNGVCLKLKNTRQCTLDKFVSNGSSRRCSENPVNGVGSSGEEEITEAQGRVCYVEIDPEAAKTWIYPDNVPRREYQLAITKTALFSNTLVALPTGLGKTLIAAVVMYNYFRWFPEGKIVFAAPSRPLVMQQIEACHNIVGIPQEWTIDMTGLTSPPKRASLWKSKRVFFVTPQVLEKDIQSGACLMKYLVCLVIDEAHRAMGNYSYCVAVRELMTVPVELRILALTATPGSKQQTIQQVIDNLQMSTLEYRSESDHDVCPYVHNRKIELIEVPMGKNAIDVNNLLLEVIRPISARLSAMGLLQNRDFQTLSPCDLLNSREKFRQAPPPELSHMKYSEVEGYFGVLITLYHVRKLLSSHGIRPAHEMLEEKLRQGYFARFMSRNESIQRAKILMQQSLSHGAPSPKLSKMMEILVDHFETNDPHNSRVIIFSNFRGSVRDILDSLANVGNSVKATEFIGQSSGKTSKGQSQKVQQAVLEKFRMGGYNVIVATSIGEEGLDIMEVDLVICFDANISPLRMIQRMGRTGRKHDGRVVVLACEGTELKGYMRKQATGKTVRKHMQNGGMKSFIFHSSPRMVPHLFKPELRFEELSIEKFVRNTKKVKNDSVQAPTFKEKLTDAEAALLEKYFSPVEKIYKPSLIAFPHFQAFPSRVHRVMHSSRTGWLIDVMQLVQGFPFSRASRTCGDNSSWSRCFATGTIEQHGESGRDSIEPINHTCVRKGIYDPVVCPSVREKHMLNSPGRVSETVVLDPSISPLKKQCALDSLIQDVGRSQLPADPEMLEAAAADTMLICTPPFNERCLSENIEIETSDAMAPKPPASPAGESDFAIADADLDPRLTDFIKSGFVPESPLNNTDLPSEEENEALLPEPISTPRSCANSLAFADEVIVTDGPQTTPVKGTPEADEIHTPLFRRAGAPLEIGGTSESPSTSRTSLQDLTNNSCSKDWRISSGEKSRTDERPIRLRRLHKVGNLREERRHNCVKGKSTSSSAKLTSRFTGGPPYNSKYSKVKRSFGDARDFIDEEAEVSSEDVADSEDEENLEDSDAYEDSFIDDRVEPTAGTSQAVDSKLDMMAIYRRSLLTQSPLQGHQNDSSVVSPYSVDTINTTTESGDCSGKTRTLQTPRGCAESPDISAGRNSVCSRLNLEKDIPSVSGNEANMGSRKRKFSAPRPFALPAKNLEKEFCSHSGPSIKESHLLNQANRVDASCAALSDDEFYDGLDLDKLEEQAAQLLSQRTGSVVHGPRFVEPPPQPQDSTLLCLPSFDLGIS